VSPRRFRSRSSVLAITGSAVAVDLYVGVVAIVMRAPILEQGPTMIIEAIIERYTKFKASRAFLWPIVNHPTASSVYASVRYFHNGITFNHALDQLI